MKNNYFKHGADWHERQNIARLILEIGYEGYGIYNVLLETFLSAGGVIDIEFTKLNRLVSCDSQLLQQVLTKYDLFNINDLGNDMYRISVVWMLHDIERSKKISRARAESGKKGMRSRYGVTNVITNDTANVITNDVANDITNVSPYIVEEYNTIDNKSRRRSSSIGAHKKFSSDSKNESYDSSCKPLTEHIPVLKNDTEWHHQLVESLISNELSADETLVVTLFDNFCKEKAARGEDSNRKTLVETKKWFFNWLLFKVKMQKKDESNRTVTPVGYGRNQATAAPANYAPRKTYADQVRESKERLLRDTIQMVKDGRLGKCTIIDRGPAASDSL